MRFHKDWLWYGALLGLGALLYVVCRLFPADLPVWLPWEFSWAEYLATTLALAWFVRGLKILPKDRHPPSWRLLCFVLGVASFYIVLQTRIEEAAARAARERAAEATGRGPLMARPMSSLDAEVEEAVERARASGAFAS